MPGQDGCSSSRTDAEGSSASEGGFADSVTVKLSVQACPSNGQPGGKSRAPSNSSSSRPNSEASDGKSTSRSSRSGVESKLAHSGSPASAVRRPRHHSRFYRGSFRPQDSPSRVRQALERVQRAVSSPWGVPDIERIRHFQYHVPESFQNVALETVKENQPANFIDSREGAETALQRYKQQVADALFAGLTQRAAQMDGKKAAERRAWAWAFWQLGKETPLALTTLREAQAAEKSPGEAAALVVAVTRTEDEKAKLEREQKLEEGLYSEGLGSELEENLWGNWPMRQRQYIRSTAAGCCFFQ